jgi:hypothetical protein
MFSWSPLPAEPSLLWTGDFAWFALCSLCELDSRMRASMLYELYGCACMLHLRVPCCSRCDGAGFAPARKPAHAATREPRGRLERASAHARVDSAGREPRQRRRRRACRGSSPSPHLYSPLGLARRALPSAPPAWRAVASGSLLGRPRGGMREAPGEEACGLIRFPCGGAMRAADARCEGEPGGSGAAAQLSRRRGWRS